MSKYFYYLSILLSFLFFTSCKKYLDKKPDGTLAVPEKLMDLQGMLDASFIMNQQKSPSFGEACADDYFLTPDGLAYFDLNVQAIYTWNRPDYFFPNDWSAGYTAVFPANYTLEILNKIPVTAENRSAWNNVKGSALFFRSYNFLNLVWDFGVAYDSLTAKQDLGIVLKLSSDFNQPSVRSSVQDCYDQILKDAYESLVYLPETSINKVRPSKIAAYGLLARAYLSMRKYDSAYKYADMALQSNSTLMNYNDDEDVDLSVQGNSPFKQFNKETIFYMEMNYEVGLPYSDFSKVDTTLYALYSENDLRKDAFFWTPVDYPQYKGSYAGVYYVYFTGLATDEMYLIRAEGNARAGRITEAMDDLNTLLVSRWNNATPYIPLTAGNKEEAVNIILTERRKELYMRGLRWIDIKRLNKENRNIVVRRLVDGQEYSLLPQSSYYALPLPADIIKETGIPQN